MSEEIKKTEEENNIPTIEEMKEKALNFANSIPNLKEKHRFMIETRGNIIELSIIIEICFNQLITETGKEMVFDHENKELHLIRGIREKRDLPGFKTKSRDMRELIECTFPELDEVSKKNLHEHLDKFVAIRDIFAHVPVNWNASGLKFSNDAPYKHFFKLDNQWENVLFAHSEFVSLFQWIIDVIILYNRQILLKKEILSMIFLGKSQAEITKLAEKNKNETTNTK